MWVEKLQSINKVVRSWWFLCERYYANYIERLQLTFDAAHRIICIYVWRIQLFGSNVMCMIYGSFGHMVVKCIAAVSGTRIGGENNVEYNNEEQILRVL